jgi:single-stranded DNA-specific DHH superfamily exonuclease
MFLEYEGECLLIHHWDTDGLCSAAMILKTFQEKNIKTWTPELSTFYLTKSNIEEIQEYDYVIIVDIALPSNNIRSIMEKSNVMVIDHHHQELIEGIIHHNPIAKGASTEDYPSTTWVLKELLNQNISIFSILGLVGDREKKIKENKKFWKIINEFIQKENLTFDNLLQMVYSIDVSYKVGDKKAVEDAPRILKEYSSHKEILENTVWKKNLVRLDKKIKEILSVEPLKNKGVLIKRLDTKYSIISTITRKIAWESNKNTLVVNTGFFPEEDQLYIRSSTINMHPLIERAKGLGINVGGKKDVLGAIIPKELTESFIEESIVFLSSH